MRALLLAAALGLGVSCGNTRNSDFGGPAPRVPLDLDSGFADGGTGIPGSCDCPGGSQCCAPLCCDLNDLCCTINGQSRCIRPFGVNTTCSDFGGSGF